eukprot:4600137-Amphidinium_carterae.1
MLTHLRSYYNEGLLSSVDDIPSFVDFFNDHGNEYSRYWRLLLRWLSYQDVEDVINKFNHAMRLRGEGVNEYPPEGEQKEKKVEKKPKGGPDPPDEEPEDSDDSEEETTGHLDPAISSSSSSTKILLRRKKGGGEKRRRARKDVMTSSLAKCRDPETS